MALRKASSSTPKRVARTAAANESQLAPMAPQAAQEPAIRSHRKVRVGVVVSDRMTKTVVVRVDHLVRHRLYPRMVRSSSRLVAHSPSGEAKVGDVVSVMETRPISRTKRWRLIEIIRRGSEAPAVPGSEPEQASDGPASEA